MNDESPQAAPRGLSFLAVAALGIAGLFAYANTFQNEFVWDDASSILLHKDVQNTANLANLFLHDQHFYGRGEGNFYRPVLSLSFMIDFAFSYTPPPANAPAPEIPAISPLLFHITSLAWHVMAAALLYFTICALGGGRTVAFCVALIFVLHPLQSEAAAYISGRGDSMAAAFMFAGLLSALKARARLNEIRITALPTVFFILAILSKESAAIFPLLLAVVLFLAPWDELWGERPSLRKRMLPVIPPLIALLVYGVLRMTVLRFAVSAQEDVPGVLARCLEACTAFAMYLKLLFVPTGLHMERTLEGIPPIAGLAGLAAIVICVALCIYGVRRNKPLAAIGMAWFLITWLPISGVFPLNAPMAEHWMYVPMAGFWLGLFSLLWPFLSAQPVRPLAVGVFAIACVLFLGMTIERNKVWRTNESIYSDTLEHNPDSFRVEYNLAVTYSDLTGNIPGAVRHYMNVLDAYDLKWEKRGNAGPRTLVWLGELEAHNSLGEIFMDAGRYDLAGTQFAKVVSVDENEGNKSEVAYGAFGLGQCFWYRGDVENAKKHFDRAIAIEPEKYQPLVDTFLNEQSGSLVNNISR